jgi:hypothetical protein
LESSLLGKQVRGESPLQVRVLSYPLKKEFIMCEKCNEAKKTIQNWVDQQGHDRCWYYPELFEKLVAMFDVQMTVEPSLPPRCEFEAGCKRYQGIWEMNWDQHKEDLTNGKSVEFRPKGNSMSPKIESGQLVKVEPIKDYGKIKKDDIVFCKVKGHYYVHLVQAVQQKNGVSSFKIGNNKGRTNGWVTEGQINKSFNIKMVRLGIGEPK